jgi:hypothetical protein
VVDAQLGVEADSEDADQGHGAFLPKAQGPGSLALLERGLLDPLQERGRNWHSPGRLAAFVSRRELAARALAWSRGGRPVDACSRGRLVELQTNSTRSARSSFKYSLMRELR